jgi:hypothetical protein
LSQSCADEQSAVIASLDYLATVAVGAALIALAMWLSLTLRFSAFTFDDAER